MQTRPYPEKDGLRIWLSADECELLLDAVENPRRRIALELGLQGLRTDEIVTTDNGPGVRPTDIRHLDSGDAHVLVIPDGKTGKRETPIPASLVQRIRYLKDAAQLRADDPILDVVPRTLRKWIDDAREALVEEAFGVGDGFPLGVAVHLPARGERLVGVVVLLVDVPAVHTAAADRRGRGVVVIGLEGAHADHSLGK